MKLSVILPCFNGADTIAVQLDALAQQQWSEPWEVIFVNNGSTDDSVAIAESYRDRLPNLRIVNAYTPPGSRQGVTHSYTVGIQAATGDAFVFCEADDEVASGWLTAMGQALQQHEFVAGALDYQRLNPSWLVGNKGCDRELQRMDHIIPGLGYSSGCKLGMRRSVYETVGGFDPACKAAWDTDYCWRVQQAGIPLHFIPHAMIYYRLPHSPLARYRKGKSWGECHMILIKKHGQPKVGWRAFKSLIRGGVEIVIYVLSLPVHSWSRQAFSDWIWSLGWEVGELQGMYRYLFLNRPIQHTQSPSTPLPREQGNILA